LDQAFLLQSERVFVLFSFKLALFSSNLINLDANFFGNWPFVFFGERFLSLWEFSSRELALSAFCQESFLSPDLAFRKLHLFLLKMLINVTTTVTLPVFADWIAISSAL
jgi:hypothetical protein